MADTKISALPAAGVAALTDELAINKGGTSNKLSVEQLADLILKRVTGVTTVAGPYETWLTRDADSSNITGTTMTTIFTLTGVGVGKYWYRVHLIYQTTALTTGIDVNVTHGATTGPWIAEHRFCSTGGAAATAAAIQNSAVATGSIYEGQGVRSQGASIGAGTVSVDTINADMHSVIEGVFEVTAGAASTFEVKMAAEAAALVCKARRGSVLFFRKLE